jgi:hypothetical protein
LLSASCIKSPSGPDRIENKKLNFNDLNCGAGPSSARRSKECDQKRAFLASMPCGLDAVAAKQLGADRNPADLKIANAPPDRGFSVSARSPNGLF